MRVMQRWSTGQLRRKHGLQETASRINVNCGVTGDVPSGSVEPKMPMTGSPAAAATCMAPESLPIKIEQAEKIAARSRMDVCPTSEIGRHFIDEQIRAAISFSLGVPKSITSAPHSEIRRSARAANRSGGQHFAAPYEAPGAIAQRHAPSLAPARNKVVSAASRADNGIHTRIGAISPRDSIQPARRINSK